MIEKSIAFVGVTAVYDIGRAEQAKKKKKKCFYYIYVDVSTAIRICLSKRSKNKIQ